MATLEYTVSGISLIRHIYKLCIVHGVAFVQKLNKKQWCTGCVQCVHYFFLLNVMGKKCDMFAMEFAKRTTVPHRLKDGRNSIMVSFYYRILL